MTEQPTYQHIRRDHTTQLIANRAKELRGDQRGLEAWEREIDAVVQSGEWMEVAAIGLMLSLKWPTRVRGILAHHDGLAKLLLHADAEAVLLDGQKVFGHLALISHRLIKLYNTSHRWLDALDVFARTPADQIDVACRREVIHPLICLKRFDETTAIIEDPGFQDRDRGHHAKQIEVALAQWNRNVSSWTADTPNRESLGKYIADKNLDGADTIIWQMYAAGPLDSTFLDHAVQILPGEEERTARVVFFRNLAYEQQPANPLYAKLYVRACFCSGRYDDALKVLHERSLELSTPEYRMLTIRAADIAGHGQTPKELTAGAAINSDFGKLVAIRAANLATWSADHEFATATELALVKAVDDPLVHRALRLSTVRFGRLATKPRVAICISGQLRSADNNLPAIIDGIAAPLGADVFVHTWDKEQSTPPRFRHLHRFLGEDLTAALPMTLRETPAFAARFPKTTRTLQSPVELTVTVDRLRGLASPIKSVVDREATFEESQGVTEGLRFARKMNQAKLFYKISACDDLRAAHELEAGIEYDVVIRIRPDLRIDVPCLEQYVQDAYANPNRVYIHYADVRGSGDQFAIASGHAMRAYSSMWKFLKQSQRFDYLPGFQNEPAEILVAHHLMAAGLETRMVPVMTNLLEAELAVVYHDLTESLESDLKTSANPSEIAPFVDFYKKWLSRNPIKKSSLVTA